MEYIVKARLSDLFGITNKGELIRCKDCRFGYLLDGTYVHCTKPFSRENHTLDWYCADGEAKAGE